MLTKILSFISLLLGTLFTIIKLLKEGTENWVYSVCHCISFILGSLAIFFKSEPENEEKCKDSNEMEPIVSRLDVKEKLENYKSQFDERIEVLKIAQRSNNPDVQEAYADFVRSSDDYYKAIKLDIKENKNNKK